MEVVGTVAATFQLVGLAMSLLDSIAQLHDVINLVPDRYQRWHTELHVLGAMINCIQQDSALHTSQVNQVLENMSPKIKSLLRLCRKYTPPANAGRIIKAIKILSAHAVEPRITEYLQSLEHDKTTLLLAIQLIPTMASSMKDLCLTDEAVYNCSPRNSDEAYSKSVSLMNPGDMDFDNSVGYVKPTSSPLFRDNRNVQPFGQMINSQFRFVQRETLVANAGEPSSSRHTVPNSSMDVDGNFEDIDVSGEQADIGHSVGPGGNSVSRDIRVRGNFTKIRVSGNKPKIGHTCQNQDRHALGRGGVADAEPSNDGLRGGGQEGAAAKTGSNTMVSDGRFTDEEVEQSFDKMDLDP